ncbi:hypothetical protein [Pseudomonas antarctica]|uniref:hypothetical protein n=1 Tax=Pseudomonas antarctica TaxID=219572 RepID=UPI003F74AE3D
MPARPVHFAITNGACAFPSTPLQCVENAWMCSLGLIPDADPITQQTLASFPMLTQGAQSGAGLFYER